MIVETKVTIELDAIEADALKVIVKYLHKEMERPGLNRWLDEQSDLIKKLNEELK